jgi:hypothetical protein
MKPARDIEYLKAMYARHVERREWKKAILVHHDMLMETMKQLRREIRQDNRERKAS